MRSKEVHLQDKYDIGVDEFLTTENPYSGQSIQARMIEVSRNTGILQMKC
ncbi:MAG: hypothetical protein R2741_09460 [Methanolobus sp.]